MKETRSIIEHIEDRLPNMSKGHRHIARFILGNYDKAAFMTAQKLGSTVGTSESTVVRFAYENGFDGYPQLQRALQEMIRNKLTSIQRIEVANDRIGNQDVLSMVMHSDIEKIRMTLEETDRKSFDASVEAIVAARRIYILGVRSSSALAGFLSFYFNLIFENVLQVNTTSSSEIFEQILRVGKEDVVIGISFPRYSKRTIKAMNYARNSGATVIAITDKDKSPIADNADLALLAPSDMASFVDSLVAPLSVINALIAAIGYKKRDLVSERLEKLERVWDEYEVYDKGDVTHV